MIFRELVLIITVSYLVSVSLATTKEVNLITA